MMIRLLCLSLLAMSAHSNLDKALDKLEIKTKQEKIATIILMRELDIFSKTHSKTHSKNLENLICKKTSM